MTEISALLELRNKRKDDKPDFIRQDYEKRKKVHHRVWRKPKGLHSKIRHHIKGKRKMPSPGYKSPSAVRGFHPAGVPSILVHSVGELSSIKNAGIIIAGSVGLKKKIEIIKKADGLGIRILNIDAESYVKKAEELMAKKKEQRAKKKVEEKKHPKREEKPADEEKKREEEKIEKDRLLIKRV